MAPENTLNIFEELNPGSGYGFNPGNGYRLNPENGILENLGYRFSVKPFIGPLMDSRVPDKTSRDNVAMYEPKGTLYSAHEDSNH